MAVADGGIRFLLIRLWLLLDFVSLAKTLAETKMQSWISASD
jgi:hypothetical protein